MQILHRVSISVTPEIRKELLKLGITVSEGLVTVVVDESHASWLAISEWIKRQRAVDVVTTKFSKSEIAAARWFELVPAWHHGYPQPDENASGYLNVTYDLGDYCQECGIGLKQKAPSRI